MPETFLITVGLAFLVGALTIIWVFNFFVLLPLRSPAFVDIVPYPASLMSKVLFGLAGAVALRPGSARSATIPIRASVRRSGKQG